MEPKRIQAPLTDEVVLSLKSGAVPVVKRLHCLPEIFSGCIHDTVNDIAGSQRF